MIINWIKKRPVLTFLSFAMLLVSCGGGGDHTGENWIVTLLFLLACLKRG
jgi:hypothetical protein